MHKGLLRHRGSLKNAIISAIHLCLLLRWVPLKQSLRRSAQWITRWRSSLVRLTGLSTAKEKTSTPQTNPASKRPGQTCSTGSTSTCKWESQMHQHMVSQSYKIAAVGNDAENVSKQDKHFKCRGTIPESSGLIVSHNFSLIGDIPVVFQMFLVCFFFFWRGLNVYVWILWCCNFSVNEMWI